MRVTFWGVRGSYPVSRRDNVRYGGNSTCIEVRADPSIPIFMDGGSGLFWAGEALLEQSFGKGAGEGHILVGHTHWDHIMAYPFFAPFYQGGNRFTFYSAGQAEADLPSILAGQHQELHFPVSFDALHASFNFRSFVPGETFTIHEVSVRTFQLNHPGITVGYRLEHGGASLVIITDTARIAAYRLGEGMDASEVAYGAAAFQRRYLDALQDFVFGADVLVHDSHFLESEIEGKEHWGHSTSLDALELAKRGKVKTLLLFHHAPEHSDDVVDGKLTASRQAAEGSGVCVAAAYEGLILELTGNGECKFITGEYAAASPLRAP